MLEESSRENWLFSLIFVFDFYEFFWLFYLRKFSFYSWLEILSDNVFIDLSVCNVFKAEGDKH